MNRMPLFFLSHGGGPWPYVEHLRKAFALTERELRALPRRLPAPPAALLVITGHWEESQFTVSTGEHPPMLYDYRGFPQHTYHVRYPARGSPQLASRVQGLLAAAGFPAGADPQRGFDHGTFVPLALMYPDAGVPVVMLSLKSTYDPQEHIRAGQALAVLRDEGVLIIGSGLTYHNLGELGRSESTPFAQAFESWLTATISEPDWRVRNQRLVHWEQAPHARRVHPHEDHLLPLMVVAGAALEERGRLLFVDHVMQVPMASYAFGSA